MVVKIHGMKQSTCTQRVSTVLKELGVAYEIIPINFAAGEHKSEAYIKNLQPFGQVPVLVSTSIAFLLLCSDLECEIILFVLFRTLVPGHLP